jgi:hypothetical protein
MINQRKKKRKDVVDPNSINKSWSSYSSGAQNLAEGFQGTGAMKHIAGSLSSDDRRINELATAQINTIQENADLRADAEDSNLDLLDRGSRYTRKNKKLKEFKDAKSAKV